MTHIVDIEDLDGMEVRTILASDTESKSGKFKSVKRLTMVVTAGSDKIRYEVQLGTLSACVYLTLYLAIKAYNKL